MPRPSVPGLSRSLLLLAMSVAVGSAVQGPLVARPAADPPPAANVVVAAAVKIAAAEHKVVWVHFGASWCGWCHKLDAMFASAEVGPILAKHFVLTALTVDESADKKALENAGAAAYRDSLGAANAGLPYFAFLDAAGKKLGDSNSMPDGSNIGYPGNPKEDDAFMALLAEVSPSLTAAERATIAAYIATHP